MTTPIGVLAALLSTATWALCAILFKKIGEKSSPVAMTTFKALISSFILFLIILVFKGASFPILNIDNLALLAISGIVGISIGDSCFFAALQRLSPIVLSIILFVGPDMFSGILGFIFLGENPVIPVWIGIILVLVGLSQLIFNDINSSDKSSKTTVTGVILALMALVCTSSSMVIIKPILSEVPVLSATMYRMFFAGIVLLLYGVVAGKIKTWKQPFSDFKYTREFLFSVILVTMGGFYLSLYAIKMCELIVASTLMSLEPFFILLLMVLFFKHKATLKEIIGCSISAVGIGIIFIFSL